MNSLVRRRLAVGAVAAASSLVVGLVVAPAGSAATNGLSINPNAVQNTTASRALTFTGSDTDFTYGSVVTFNRTPFGTPFTVNTADQSPKTGKTNTGSATVNFTDVGNGLGSDGPADAGVYNVTSSGSSAPLPVGPPGGGIGQLHAAASPCWPPAPSP